MMMLNSILSIENTIIDYFYKVQVNKTSLISSFDHISLCKFISISNKLKITRGVSNINYNQVCF